MSAIDTSDTSLAHLPRMGLQLRPMVSSALRVIFLVSIAMVLILVLLPAAVGAVGAQAAGAI